MTRYIDAEKLEEGIFPEVTNWYQEGWNDALKGAMLAIPTADVAPRAEVAREIFNDITKMFFEKQRQYENSRQSGKARQMMIARFEVYKLQKKYTGEPK